MNRVLIVWAVMLVGCQSTGVIKMDQDSYMIGKKDGSPGVGVSYRNKAAVYKEANAFCSKSGREVQTMSVNTIPSALGQLGSTELIFKCVLPGGAAQPLVGAPDKVIEIRNR